MNGMNEWMNEIVHPFVSTCYITLCRKLFSLLHSSSSLFSLSPFLTRCQARRGRASPQWHGQGQWSWEAPAPARSGHVWRSGQSHRRRRSVSWSQSQHTGPAHWDSLSIQGLLPCAANTLPTYPRCVLSNTVSQSATVSTSPICCTWFGYY